jgi:hypothetical protein
MVRVDGTIKHPARPAMPIHTTSSAAPLENIPRSPSENKMKARNN